MKAVKRCGAISLIAMLLCVQLSSSTWAAGTENVPNETNTSSESLEGFIDFVSPLYEGGEEFSAYEIKGINGENLKEQMVADTQDLADNGEWEEVREYCRRNLSAIEYTQTGKLLTRAGDIAKWGTKTIQRFNVPRVSGYNYSVNTTDVRFKISGTIYYDPNTKVISSVSSTTVTDQSSTNGTVGVVDTYSYHSNYTGTFKAIAHPKWDVYVGSIYQGTMVFDNVEGVLEVSPD